MKSVENGPLSQTDSAKKKSYDGKTILTHEVFNNRNMLGKFIWNLWSKLGGSEKEFEKQQVGSTLEIAAQSTLVALNQTTRRITGIASGTGNTTPQAHNKGLLWIIEPRHGKMSITDSGVIAMTLWQLSISPSEHPKINDDKAMNFMVRAAEALIETCGYTVDELKAFEANRD